MESGKWWEHGAQRQPRSHRHAERALAKECTMSPAKQAAKKYGKASKRRYLKPQEHLARDRRQAQQAAKALEQALDALGLPEDLVAEIVGRLRSQQKLLGKPKVPMDAILNACRTP